ncbi:hypothetical protein HanRHA438_Chr01g0017211 [Helianthus annuus]|nr:hypothetical protein HanRHA438_Chr01g0017211 [Helianthus annuus]
MPISFSRASKKHPLFCLTDLTAKMVPLDLSTARFTVPNEPLPMQAPRIQLGVVVILSE